VLVLGSGSGPELWLSAMAIGYGYGYYGYGRLWPMAGWRWPRAQRVRLGHSPAASASCFLHLHLISPLAPCQPLVGAAPPSPKTKTPLGSQHSTPPFVVCGFCFSPCVLPSFAQTLASCPEKANLSRLQTRRSCAYKSEVDL
jgi:hypothetical protein